MNPSVTRSPGSRLDPDHEATGEAACGVLPKPRSGARAGHGPRLDWIRVAGIAAAVSVNSLAVLYGWLPAAEHDSSFAPAERADGPRHALVVELFEPVAIALPEKPAPPLRDRAVSRHAARHSLSLHAPAVPVSEADPALEPAPRLRFGVSQWRSLDEVSPLPASPRDPKAAAAKLYRPPAITYEPTRFSDAWQSVSLAERARQSTFSYARHCSLSDETRQIRGCSREERNAVLPASRGSRIDTSIRPDGAVE